MYTVGKITGNKDHDGMTIYKGAILLEGKKVGEVREDYNGGCMHIDFNSGQIERNFISYAKTKLLDMTNYNGEPFNAEEMSDFSIIEEVIGQLLEEGIKIKEELAAIKKGVAFYLKHDKFPDNDPAMYVQSSPYTKSVVDSIRAEYGNRLLEILNEKHGMPLLDEAAGAEAHKMAQYKKQCKNSVLFSVKDAADPSRIVDKIVKGVKYSQAIVKQLQSKYGDSLVEIYNERFI